MGKTDLELVVEDVVVSEAFKPVLMIKQEKDRTAFAYRQPTFMNPNALATKSHKKRKNVKQTTHASDVQNKKGTKHYWFIRHIFHSISTRIMFYKGQLFSKTGPVP